MGLLDWQRAVAHLVIRQIRLPVPLQFDLVMKKRSRTPYRQIMDGERHVMPHLDWLNMCCDCGMVHFIRLRLKRRGEKTVLTKQVWSMPRRTAAARRGKRYKGLRLPKTL